MRIKPSEYADAQITKHENGWSIEMTVSYSASGTKSYTAVTLIDLLTNPEVLKQARAMDIIQEEAK